MKAIDTELTKFLGAEAQYYVPIYQRKYSWKKDNCLKLIDDILKVAKDNERPCHFIGSVIYLAKQDAMHASAVKEYLVIDGQQRLTTISIVLLALGDYTRAKIVDDVDYNKATTSLEKLSRRYLTNEDETGDTYYKVRLNEEDFYAWMKLLENRTKPDDIKRSKIFENYRIIYKRFSDKVDCTDKAGNAIGYRHTPIKISSYLTTVSKWGEDEILARAEMLSDELITIWKYPKKD